MAKNRFSSKKSGKRAAAVHRSGGHRKNPRRVAAGRRAWNTLKRRYGGKEAAIAATFGKRARMGGVGFGKRARYAPGRGRGILRELTGAKILALVQQRNGTVGLPPTEAELARAREIAGKVAEKRRFRDVARNLTPEERHRVDFKRRLDEMVRAEAQRVAFNKKRAAAMAKAEAERKREFEEAKAAVEAEIANIQAGRTTSSGGASRVYADYFGSR